jgi:hypothetical protein
MINGVQLMMAEITDRTKVVFDLERGEAPYETESVWAEQISDNHFRVLNSPFYIFGISFEDEVEAEPFGAVFKFVRVVQRSGRSTYRIILQGENTIAGDEFLKMWEPFRNAGCTFEAASPRYIAVDMPPSANVAELYELLERGEEQAVWVFEEGHYAGILQQG